MSIKAKQPDYILIINVLFLVIIGLVVLSSASIVISQDYFDESYYFLKHQLIYGLLLGGIGFFICQRINYRFWKKISFPLIILSISLLALVLFPKIGIEHGGARRWIGLGGLSFQPFEIVKIVFIIYLAGLLSRKGKDENVIKKSFLPIGIIFSLICILLLLQPSTSAVGLMVLILTTLYFLAGIRLSYIFVLFALALASFFALIKTSAYRMNRLTVYLHPETDPQGIGYQINQALMAIGSGGLFGLGLGHSIQKWQYLPEVIGDSIFAIIAEEWGLIGALLIIFLFFLFAWRGLRISKNAPDKFGYLLAGGITCWIFFQAFINIAAICGIIPLTGMPLPFISYGGTGLAILLSSVGILVNISKYN